MNIEKKPLLYNNIYKANTINWAKNFVFALLLVAATILCESNNEFKYNLGIALLASTIVTIVFETIKLVERLESISKIEIAISKEVFLIIIEIYNELKDAIDKENEIIKSAHDFINIITMRYFTYINAKNLLQKISEQIYSLELYYNKVLGEDVISINKQKLIHNILNSYSQLNKNCKEDNTQEFLFSILNFIDNFEKFEYFNDNFNNLSADELMTKEKEIKRKISIQNMLYSLLQTAVVVISAILLKHI